VTGVRTRARIKLQGAIVAALMTACVTLPPGQALAQYMGIEGRGPMRIPSLEELSRPLPPRVAAPAPQEEETGEIGRFINDPTLRSGDIVVTPDGPLQYRGAEAARRKREDFAPMNAPALTPRREPLTDNVTIR